MLKVNIKGKRGKVIDTISLPEKVSEITLSQFTSFEAAFSERNKWLLEYNDLADPSFMLRYINWTIDLLGEFNLSDLSKTALGPWKEHIQKISRGKEFDYEGIEGNILGLLAHVYNLITSYRVEIDFTKPYQFTHKGKAFVLPVAERDVITQSLSFQTIETSRVIEALRVHDVYIKNKEDDPNGNFFFTSLLYCIACFALRPNESFPNKQNEINTFINQRVKFFEDLDMKTGLEAAAFFLRASNLLKGISRSAFFGILQNALEAVSKTSTLGQKLKPQMQE